MKKQREEKEGITRSKTKRRPPKLKSVMIVPNAFLLVNRLLADRCVHFYGSCLCYVINNMRFFNLYRSVLSGDRLWLPCVWYLHSKKEYYDRKDFFAVGTHVCMLYVPSNGIKNTRQTVCSSMYFTIYGDKIKQLLCS